MSFEDRFSRRVVNAPPAETCHAGRWVVREKGAAGVRVNRVAARSGDALMPGPTGEWEVGRGGLEDASAGQFFPDALPSDQDVEALLQLGQRLREESHEGWLAWSEVNPLAPGLNEAVRPHPFEDRIEDELQHLEAVCRKPRTHIRLEVERELVGRARRIAREAPEWLAAHTEDWHHRTLAGVQPRRIRAEIREERWNLYENRVAARLVDNLVVWLRRRIAEVRRIRDDILRRFEELDDTAQGSGRHRAERIYSLWGEAWHADWQEVADNTLKRLERLLYEVLALKDSSLYRHMPQRAQVPRTLRMTNLLTTDDDYRGVAHLWHQWSLLPTRDSLSPRMHYQRQQDLHRSFDAWCMLLVVRACSQLRICPADDDDWESALAKGHSVQLEKGLRVEWEDCGSVSIGATQEMGGLTLRFVPSLQSLESARTEDALAQRVAPITDAVAEQPHWTVVLHPGSASRAPYDAIATIGNPPQPGVPGAVDFIRVSPFSLDCVERVARAIRWATLVPRLLAYPPSVSAPPDESYRAERWLDEDDNGRWAMVALPRGQKSMQHDVGRRLREAEKRERSAPKRQPAKKDEAKKAVDEWRTFKQTVDAAIAKLCELRTCPRCGGERAEFQQRGDRCFTARCWSDSCRAQWGLHALPDGKGQVPVFLDPTMPNPAAGPHEIDELVGCDILALPNEDAPTSFLHPRRHSVSASLHDLLRDRSRQRRA